MSALDDVVAVGARVTYMLGYDHNGKPTALGDRPHCPPFYRVPGATQCVADINITNEGDPESINERCSREVGHHGPHVVLASVGLPTLAWLVDRR